MKYADMNENQKQVFRLVSDECNHYIGGWENQMMDYSEGTEEYEEAQSALSQSHEELVDTLFCIVRHTREWENMENLHFVSLDWMKERVDKRLKKMGY